MSRRAPAARAPSALAEPAPCLLVNPRSFGAARKVLVGRATQMARAHGLHVVHAAHPGEIEAAVTELLSAQRPVLFLLAGDGTVQLVADRLASRPDATPSPYLFLLGGGRTNLTAADLGGCGAVLAKLETALRRWRDGPQLRCTHRRVLRIEQAPAPVRHGFFVGAGLVDHAIRACHRDRSKGNAKLRQSDLGTAFSLLKLALPALTGLRSLPLDALQVEAAGQPPLPRPARLLIATTLSGRRGLLDPYAERGQGNVRFTALSASGPGVWARLPQVITGRFSPAMDAARGYLSGRCDALRILGLSSYTLDGEEFEADPARPVTIASGPRLAFLTL